MTKSILLLSLLLAAGTPVPAAQITVKVDDPGRPVSPLLYGIFFEEINRAGDGGLYAEMVQNRSFEDAAQPAAWSLVKGAGLALDKATPLNGSNPTSLRMEGPGAIANEGFKGIGVLEGRSYRLSLYARGNADLGATLEGPAGQSLAGQFIGRSEGAWKKFEVVLKASGSAPDARLVLTSAGPGPVWLDMVSLFPVDAVHGFRPDLLQMLKEMRPAFVRFPGGCFVEGDKLENAVRWKKTIGDIAERPGHWNLWGYRSTDGLGYHEYLQLCEDLGAEPLHVVNCGMSHVEQRLSDQGKALPVDEEYVQDALDSIEYANGPVDSTWGALRARAGHPAPFHLKYLEIGNENGGPLYDQRYERFYDAIKARYPDVKLVANQWRGVVKSRPIEILDEHYYNTPGFFTQHAGRYDTYDRKGPKIYVGEYAVTRDAGQGNLQGAVGEAAFMTGMERNSDVVIMSSYAPLFCHPGWKRWNPNAIVFDAARAYGIPSYHVQAMFGANRGDVVQPVEIQQPLRREPIRGRIGVGTWGTQAEFKDIRVTQGDRILFASDFTQGHAAWKIRKGTWETQDGALRQTSDEEGALALVGDTSWSDCTLALKARKLGGREGFLISFGMESDDARSHWNIGGWGNKEHAFEAPGLSDAKVTGTVETGRWYDIRIDMAGGEAKAFLDGKLVQSAARGLAHALFAVAGRDNRTGETILKVVNSAQEATETTIILQGAKPGPVRGAALVLADPDPRAENSFEAPRRIVPRPEPVEAPGGTFTRIFPANSVTVLRLRAR